MKNPVPLILLTVLLLLLPVSFSFSDDGVTLLITELMSGTRVDDPPVTTLIEQGVDPGEALERFLALDYRSFILSDTFAMSDDADIVVERLINLIDDFPRTEKGEEVHRIAGNNTFYSGERIRIVKALIKAGAYTGPDSRGRLPESLAEEAGNAAIANYLTFLRDENSVTYDPDEEGFQPKYTTLPEQLVFFDLNRILKIIQSLNNGEECSIPKNWFSGKSRGSDLVKLNYLVSFVEEPGRGEAADLLRPFLDQPDLETEQEELLREYLRRFEHPGDYLFSPFPWFAFPARMELTPGVSLLLPKGNWLDIRSEQGPGFFDSILQGRDMIRQVTVYGHALGPNYNLRQDYIMWKPSIRIRIPGGPGEDMEYRDVPIGPPRAVAENVVIGDLFVRKLYAQIVVSSYDQSPEQGVLVRHIFLTDKNIIAVTAKTYIDKRHALCMEDYLVAESILILRTLSFNNEHEKDFLLAQAIREERPDSLMSLLDSRDPNAALENGDSLIHLAMEKESHDFLEILLEAGANPDTPDHAGLRPLSRALDKGDHEKMELLIRHGAQTTYVNEDLSNPLIKAVLRGDDRAVSLLLRGGAGIDFFDRWGRGPLQWACQMGFTNIVNMLLLSNPEIEQRDVFGYSPLYWAAVYGWTDIVELLRDAGADINARHENTTPLMSALRRERLETAAFLLQNGADMDERWARENGWTAVIEHLRSGNPAKAEAACRLRPGTSTR